jgi:hypothetical protein
MGRRLVIIGGSQQGAVPAQPNVPRDVRHRGTSNGLEARELDDGAQNPHRYFAVTAANRNRLAITSYVRRCVNSQMMAATANSTATMTA